MPYLTYRYRIYPSPDQASRMSAWLERLRQVYNEALAERKTWIRSRRCRVDACSLQEEYILPCDSPQPTFYSQKKSLTRARRKDASLADLHSQVLQEVLGRADLAFKNLWERGLGLPRFKKAGRLRSMVFPQLKAHPIVESPGKIQGLGLSATGRHSCQKRARIKLPKIGLMPISLHRPLPVGVAIKQIRVVRKASGWFALLTLHVNLSLSDPLPLYPLLGVYCGEKTLCTTSDGERVVRPPSIEKRQRQLKSLQRRLHRKQLGSNNARKLCQRLTRLSERIEAAQRDYYYNVAHRLCDRAGTIFWGDSTLSELTGRAFAGLTSNTDSQTFSLVLAWVCWKRGVYFDRVEGRDARRVCPQCEVRTDSPNPQIRTYRCPECGYRTEREVAIAQVLVRRGIAAVGQAVAGANGGSLEQIACGGDRPGTAA